MRSSSRSRPGIALAVALAAIVIIGGLLVGIFYASTQEYRIGRNNIMQARALNGAEYGLNRLLAADFQTSWKTVVAKDSMLGVLAYQPSPSTVDTVRVTSLGNGMYNVTSESYSGTSRATARARKRIAALIVLRTVDLNLRGALTTRGATKIGGSTYINGYDTTVANWGCPPPGSPMPGIAIADSTQVSTSGCSGYTCVNGSPPVQQDSAAADTATYTQFGDVSWSELASMATLSYSNGTTLTGMAPSYSGAACNTADSNNWGDPLRTTSPAYCANYYPIIYGQGDLTLSGGYGQGLLVVNGDLTVSGGFQFFGPVIVRGTLKTTGTGGHFNGGVMAENIDLSQNTVLGNAVVSFSSCAINMALQASAAPMFAKGRSWTDLY